MNTSKVSKNSLSSFYKNVKPMFLASLFTQVISFITSIYLAKIYGEIAYGYFGSFISSTAFFSMIFTLQQENNIITKQANKEYWYNTTQTISIVFFIITGITGIVAFYFDFLKEYNFIYFAILGGFLLSISTINENLLTTNKLFSRIALGKVLISITAIFFQFTLFKHFSNLGLIYGGIISFSLGALFYLSSNYAFIKKINLNKLKIVFSKDNTLLTYLLPSNILNSIAINGMPILILFCFDAKQAGVFFLSLKILSAPLQLLTNSITKVYFQKASELYTKNISNIFSFTYKIVKRNFTITLICLLFINTIGIYILELFFNKNWENLRFFTLLLSFLILCRSLFNPISSIIVITDKNHISLAFNCYLILSNILAVVIGYLYNNINLTILILSVLGGLGYVYLLLYFRNFLKQRC